MYRSRTFTFTSLRKYEFHGGTFAQSENKDKFSQKSACTNFNKIPSRDEKRKWSPLFLRISLHRYVLFHITRAKNHSTINPAYFLRETYPPLPCCAVPLPLSRNHPRFWRDVDWGGGRNKIACPLHARVLRNRSCVARGRVSLIPGRCFSPGFTRRRYVKREYLE